MGGGAESTLLPPPRGAGEARGPGGVHNRVPVKFINSQLRYSVISEPSREEGRSRGFIF